MKNRNDIGVTLVFPAVGQAALEYVKAAKKTGGLVICAASVVDEEMAAEVEELFRLPSIHDVDFESAFCALASKHNVSCLLCPVSTVYAFMSRFLPAHNLEIELIGQSPVERQIEQIRELRARAGHLMPLVRLCADGAPTLSLLEVAGVLRQAGLIYGESNDAKLAAMMGIFARAPVGDVVEIGSLMGRSAFVLLYLARRFGIGPLLTVDPWEAAECIQKESPDSLQFVTDEWDYEVLREGFMTNMMPFQRGDHAHFRQPSNMAFASYLGDKGILSLTDGPVTFSRKIAVMHIDGNHDYSSVKMDCTLWLERMLPGAWLILDDYIWSHGDGPYRAGNELLQHQSDRIESAFVCGKALFAKLRY